SHGSGRRPGDHWRGTGICRLHFGRRPDQRAVAVRSSDRLTSAAESDQQRRGEQSGERDGERRPAGTAGAGLLPGGRESIRRGGTAGWQLRSSGGRDRGCEFAAGEPRRNRYAVWHRFRPGDAERGGRPSGDAAESADAAVPGDVRPDAGTADLLRSGADDGRTVPVRRGGSIGSDERRGGADVQSRQGGREPDAVHRGEPVGRNTRRKARERAASAALFVFGGGIRGIQNALLRSATSENTECALAGVVSTVATSMKHNVLKPQAG